MSNPVEIVRKVFEDEFCGTLDGEKFAKRAIATLRKEGYQVIRIITRNRAPLTFDVESE